MRISDWSSDVCSSDLLMARLGAIEAFIGLDRHDDRLGEIFAAPDLRQIGVRDLPLVRIHRHDRGAILRAGVGALPVLERRDRKSGVVGQRVSVRLDLGGLRLIKKKTKNKTITR